MPLNYKLLAQHGTSNERLQQLFTASAERIPSTATQEEKEEALKDVEMRRKIEDLIGSRIDDAILHNLRFSHLIAAVDLAWDSSLITRRTIPLVMYAQHRINQSQCVKSLQELGCADQYVRRTKEGKEYVDLPKFCEVNVNMVRSILTRRVGAQSARYTNLWPFFRYDSRGTSEEEKLRGDLMSQRADIMADQYGYRWAQVQWIRDMLMYPTAIAFPASAWDREVEWYDGDAGVAAEFKAGDGQQAIKVKSRVVREGVPWIMPHASRVFYDLNHPPQSINSDTGCEWFGFWDVARYGAIADNPDFFNRSEIGYGDAQDGLFTAYSSYFDQYYTRIAAPDCSNTLATGNDRKYNAGTYNSAMRDSSVFLTHLYLKVKPNQWRMGRYPFNVWLHLVVANSRTVVFAEIMPDCPGAVFTYNTSAQRMVNLSMGMELLHWQDQVSNLYTELLEAIKRDLFQLNVLNLDAFPVENESSKAILEEFREAMRSDNFYSRTTVLEVSLSKMRDLGVDLNSVFAAIRMPPNTKITEIINAIAQTFQLAERTMSMSAQEQGQIAQRETSATENQIIAGTTENIYQFISDAIDEGRSAIKRYIYNALMALGTDEIYLPVIKRYRTEVAERAGFKVVDEEPGVLEGRPRLFSVRGTKANLIAEYIFNSRDGAERSSNIQASNTLVQMLQVMMQPAVLGMLTRDNLADIINTIIRQSGAGVDVLVEPSPGTGGKPVLEAAPPPMAPTAGIPPEAMSASGIAPTIQ